MENCYYIYRYICQNKPIYIGKGRGQRAFKISNHNAYYKRLHKKYKLKIEFLLKNLDESEAFQKEIEFISFYKQFGMCQANFTNGGEGTSGRKFSHKEETKKFLSIIGTGKKLSKETREKLSITLRGKVKTEKHRKNLSISSLGKKMSAEAKFKMSKHKKGKPSRNRKKVLDINTNIVYESALKASEFIKINYKTLMKYLSGEIKTNPTSLRYL